MEELVYDPALMALLRRAFRRLRSRFEEGAPTLAAHTAAWMASLVPEGPVEAYFTHPQAFPMVLLPWWLEGRIRPRPAGAFHGDVVYSTINGYYFVRLIDNLMDREVPPPPDVLPALIVLHTEFQHTYLRYFGREHPFWDSFISASLASAETASADVDLAAVDGVTFERISSRKVAGAKVPIAAVCHRYGRLDLLEPWSRFVDVLGRWHQMHNDMLGWNRDLDAGRPSYLLSEGRRRVGPTGSVSEWMVVEGLWWAFGELESSMDQVLAAAGALECPPLLDYLGERQRSLVVEREDLAPSLAAIGRLAEVMR